MKWKKQITMQIINTEKVNKCFAASTSQKSEANKFIEIFVYDNGKYCFDWSFLMALSLVIEVYFMF